MRRQQRREVLGHHAIDESTVGRQRFVHFLERHPLVVLVAGVGIRLLLARLEDAEDLVLDLCVVGLIPLLTTRSHPRAFAKPAYTQNEPSSDAWQEYEAWRGAR